MFTKLPNVLSISKTSTLVGVAVGIAFCAVATVFYPRLWWILLFGLAAVGLLLLAYELFQLWRLKRRGHEVDQKIVAASRLGDISNDAGVQADLDDLEKKFARGVETLESLGLDLYRLPWYVIVGQTASGKSEAIRRCGITFPNGLTDELQGTGGTVNMDWWFTHHAVILDTAGKMLFQETPRGDSSLWIQFLHMVRDARPSCPINGMLLVIPASSLIGDSSEQIQHNARTIAHQLDLIRRTLGVRFPVYVLVTKCDLITGFREFFDGLDHAEQSQILGWSNPKSRDTPFDASEVEDHLQQVRRSLELRRFSLLQDPIHRDGPNHRRLDEVDRLYDFPTSLEEISAPLRQYLEVIFAEGPLSPKPLFLRGIYFTSSIQEGGILDKVLAEALGVPLHSLNDVRISNRERTLFLRDVFIEKAFQESKLVTWADNSRQILFWRRMLLLGTALTSLVILVAMSWIGLNTFQRRIGGHEAMWKDLAQHVNSNNGPPMLIKEYGGQKLYNGEDPMKVGKFKDSIGTLPVLTRRFSNTRIEVPLVFRLFSGLRGDLLHEDRNEAHRSLLSAGYLRPAVEEAMGQLLDSSSNINDAVRLDALAQLIRLRTYKAGLETLSDSHGQDEASRDQHDRERLETLLEIEPLIRTALPQEQDIRYDSDIRSLEKVIDDTYNNIRPKTRQSTAAYLLTNVQDNSIEKSLGNILSDTNAVDVNANKHLALSCIFKLIDALTRLEEAEDKLHSFQKTLETDRLADKLDKWAHDYDLLKEAADDAEAALKAFKAAGLDPDLPYDELCRSAGETDIREVRQERDLLIKQLPPDDLGSADPFLDLIRNMVLDRYKNYEGTIGSQVTNAQQQIERLKIKYLDRIYSIHRSPKSRSDRPFALLYQIYREAQEFDVMAIDEDELGDLARNLRTINERLNKSNSDFEQHTQYVPEKDPRFENAFVVAKLVCEAKSRRLRTELVLKTAKKVRTDFPAPQDVRQRVAELSEGYSEEPWQRPLIIPNSRGFSHGSGVEAFKFGKEYDPVGLHKFVGDWDEVVNEWGNNKRRNDLFVESNKVKEAMAEIDNCLDPYIEEYIDYWTKEVVAAADYKEADSWEDFQRAVDVPAQQVQDGLNKLAVLIEKAILPVPRMFIDEDDTRLRTAKMRLTPPPYSGFIKQYVEPLRERWSQDDDAEETVKKFRRMRVEDVKKRHLRGVYTESSNHLPRYWHNFAQDPFRLLSQITQAKQQEALIEFDEKYNRFPLVNSPDRSTKTTLNHDALADAIACIRLLLGKATDNEPYAEGTIGAGAETGFTELDTYLAALSNNSQLNKEGFRNLERMLKIGEALANEQTPIQVTLVIPTLKFLESHVPSWAKAGHRPGGVDVDMTCAVERFPEIRIFSKRFRSFTPTRSEDNPQQYDMSMPSDGPVRIEFHLVQNGMEKKSHIDFNPPWPAIDTFLSPDGLSDVVMPMEAISMGEIPEGEIVYIPLRIEDENQEYYYWIGLQFDRSLPSPKKWPTKLQ